MKQDERSPDLPRRGHVADLTPDGLSSLSCASIEQRDDQQHGSAITGGERRNGHTMLGWVRQKFAVVVLKRAAAGSGQLETRPPNESPEDKREGSKEIAKKPLASKHGSKGGRFRPGAIYTRKRNSWEFRYQTSSL